MEIHAPEASSHAGAVHPPESRLTPQGDGHHHGAVAEGKQGAAQARPARVGLHVETGQAVDGGQVVGIEAVLHP